MKYNCIFILLEALIINAQLEWQRISTFPTLPSPRKFATVEYDSERNFLIVFGGWNNNAFDLNDTWVLDISLGESKKIIRLNNMFWFSFIFTSVCLYVLLFQVDGTMQIEDFLLNQGMVVPADFIWEKCIYSVDVLQNSAMTTFGPSILGII